jgi:hypothetical protein
VRGERAGSCSQSSGAMVRPLPLTPEELHPEALAEYRAAARYYQSIRAELGERFTDVIADALRRIIESPATWRILEDDVRRCLTHVFRMVCSIRLSRARRAADANWSGPASIQPIGDPFSPRTTLYHSREQPEDPPQ